MKKELHKEIVLANPRGFCAGVDRAIDIVEKSLDKFKEPVYVRHQVVHNKKVVEDLEKKGVKFVKEVSEIPDNAVAIFSAQGVSQKVEDEAKNRNCMYFDASCPLVTKVHLEVQKHAQKGRDIILIGHKGHPEVIGTLGRHPSNSNTKIYLVENNNDIKKLEIVLKNNNNLLLEYGKMTKNINSSLVSYEKFLRKYDYDIECILNKKTNGTIIIKGFW